uniref:Peptidase S1 domain-containing protein n=1 Tax=Meloidogyne incognita TaxID=6306 RepID=A0A914MTF7_MELIC
MFSDILQPKIFFIFLFFYFQFLNFVNGILAGEEIDWNRNGFVVKVLAREGPNAPTKSCTGSLISASLVLTSGDCVVDRSTKESLNEFVVFVSKPSDKELRSTGKLLERNEQNGWALLRIAPQNITELCPPSPAPKWVARLNFRPLLTSGPRLEVSQADLSSGEGAVCFFVGFTTTEKGKKLLKIFLKFYFLAEDFLNENRLLRIYLDKLEKPPKDDGLNQYRSDVYSGFTACYVSLYLWGTFLIFR